MKISYKRLWKLLIDRNLKKKDLIKLADISKTYSVLTVNLPFSVFALEFRCQTKRFINCSSPKTSSQSNFIEAISLSSMEINTRPVSFSNFLQYSSRAFINEIHLLCLKESSLIT